MFGPRKTPAHRLWAITTYFNPRGYRSRRANYGVFRRALGVPLLTVELANPLGFDVGLDQADILVRVPRGDLIWQKERLLNVALDRLPAACDTVAWLDCDVLFADDEWAVRADRALAEVALVQPFDHLVHLRPGEWPPTTPAPDALRRGFAAAWPAGTLPSPFFRNPQTSADERCNCGMAWVARRDVIARHGFYDTMVLGMGDKAMAAAAVNRAGDAAASFDLSAAHGAHFHQWAGAFARTVGGRVGAVPGRLLHLWHGDLADRHYVDRYQGFSAHAFDPDVDLEKNANGAWVWRTDQPALRRRVADYFSARREDGSDDGLPVAAAV